MEAHPILTLFVKNGISIALNILEICTKGFLQPPDKLDKCFLQILWTLISILRINLLIKEKPDLILLTFLQGI